MIYADDVYSAEQDASLETVLRDLREEIATLREQVRTFAIDLMPGTQRTWAVHYQGHELHLSDGEYTQLAQAAHNNPAEAERLALRHLARQTRVTPPEALGAAEAGGANDGVDQERARIAKELGRLGDAERLAWVRGFLRGYYLTVEPCPTCTGQTRETVGMVCQTCGTDYGRPRQTQPETGDAS